MHNNSGRPSTPVASLRKKYVWSFWHRADGPGNRLLGYKASEPFSLGGPEPVPIKQFVEKLDQTTAEQFLVWSLHVEQRHVPVPCQRHAGVTGAASTGSDELLPGASRAGYARPGIPTT